MAGLLADAGCTQAPVSENGVRHQTKDVLTGEEEKANKEANQAEIDLNLNADQKAKWQAAAFLRIHTNKPYKQKLKVANSPEEIKQLKKLIKANKKKFNQTVRAFLTAEQNALWLQLKSKRKEMKQRNKVK
ncbi:MAG: hypothetical protein MUF75_03835 [Bacteroidia bacterium]|nr:hypothetical protein [Bacteroidia bacterium]